MVVLISVNVTIRALDWGVIAWADEISEYAVYAITLLAAPWLLHQGAHVRVDIVVTSIRPAAGWVLELIADLCGLGVCLVLLGYATPPTTESAAHRLGDRQVAGVPRNGGCWRQLPVCFLLLALEFALPAAAAGQRAAGGRGRRPAAGWPESWTGSAPAAILMGGLVSC